MEDVIIVAENVQGKFGPQLKGTDGSFYSFGTFYKGPTSFDQGTSLTVELYTTERGSKYINKVLSSNKLPIEPVKSEVKRGRPKKTDEIVNKAEKETVKSVDWDKIAYGKVRSLFVQSLMPMLITNPQNEEEVKAVVTKWAKWVCDIEE